VASIVEVLRRREEREFNGEEKVAVKGEI